MSNDETFEAAEVIRDAIRGVFESPNVTDSNGEQANIVDAIAQLASCSRFVGEAICRPGIPCPCPSGNGQVGDLTEAVVSVAATIQNLADSVSEVAHAIGENNAANTNRQTRILD